MIYLDTHIVVWLYAGEIERLSPLVQKHIENGPMCISPAVILELQYLYEIKKIGATSQKIILDLESKIQLDVVNCPFKELMITALDEDWTRDPFDRMIVAQARFFNVPLISKDRQIKKHYSKTIF